MKEQKTGENRIEVANEIDAQPKSERRRPIENDGEPGVVRIRLPQTVGMKAKEAVAELRARGAQVTLDEFLSEYVEAIPERYFDSQLQKRTPEPYYLEAASKVPELRDMLIRHAKKGLIRASVQDSTVAEPRQKRRKAVGAEAVENRGPLSDVPGNKVGICV